MSEPTGPGEPSVAPEGHDVPAPPDQRSARDRRGVGALTADDFSFADAVGGVRGLVESTAPGLVFVVVFVATRDLRPPLIAACALALAAVVVRLVQRTPVTQAFSGALGVGIGVLWAWRTGEAENFFAGGLLVNVAYLLGTAVSALIGWPVVGLLVGLLQGDLTMSWRTDPDQAHARRRFTWATWLWASVFALRLAVQVPFYLAGDVAALGTAKLVMGVPLFAVTLWLTWLLVGSSAARADRRGPHPSPRR